MNILSQITVKESEHRNQNILLCSFPYNPNLITLLFILFTFYCKPILGRDTSHLYLMRIPGILLDILYQID